MEENVSLCHDGILRLCCRILVNKIKRAKDIMKNFIKDLKTFLILWSTQSFSQLGSAMTGFALTLWVYERTGSALQTALLSVCTYAPYVLMSIFAGALSDRWDKKKVMLVCDISDYADLSGNRELSAVFYQDAGVLVSGPADRMASGTGHECKPGCGAADFDSCGNAGQSVFLQKYPAVFYDPHRNAAGRLSDRSCLRTGDGFCRGR